MIINKRKILRVSRERKIRLKTSWVGYNRIYYELNKKKMPT